MGRKVKQECFEIYDEIRQKQNQKTCGIIKYFQERYMKGIENLNYTLSVQVIITTEQNRVA